MKQLIITCAAMALLIGNARADFNTDGKRGAVQCISKDGDFVEINAARSNFMIHSNGDEGDPTQYRVSRRESDGDTYVSYIAKDGTNLSFDDRGDSLIYGDTKEKIELNCK